MDERILSGTIILNKEEDEPFWWLLAPMEDACHVYVVPHLGYVGCRSRAGESIIIIIIIKGTLLL